VDAVRQTSGLQQLLLEPTPRVDRIKLVAGGQWGDARPSSGACNIRNDGSDCADVLLGTDRQLQQSVPAGAAPGASARSGFCGGILHAPAAGRPQGIRRDLCRLGLSEPFFRTEGYRQFGASTSEEFVINFWEHAFIHSDANDLLTLLRTWDDGDVSDNPAFGGDFSRRSNRSRRAP